MFEQQRQFMDLLRERRNFPDFPVDLSSKNGQKFCKSIAYEMMGEIFEAIQELKNSKDHRETEQGFDKQSLVTEFADALHYFNEILILMDVSPEELFDAYMKKGKVNEERIKSGY